MNDLVFQIIMGYLVAFIIAVAYVLGKKSRRK